MQLRDEGLLLESVVLYKCLPRRAVCILFLALRHVFIYVSNVYGQIMPEVFYDSHCAECEGS